MTVGGKSCVSLSIMWGPPALKTPGITYHTTSIAAVSIECLPISHTGNGRVTVEAIMAWLVTIIASLNDSTTPDPFYCESHHASCWSRYYSSCTKQNSRSRRKRRTWRRWHLDWQTRTLTWIARFKFKFGISAVGKTWRSLTFESSSFRVVDFQLPECWSILSKSFMISLISVASHQ